MNDTCILLRQVHPNFVQDGFASSVVFRPNASDHGLMSVYDSDLITAENSWIHYTTISNKLSCGTTGLQYKECTLISLVPRSDTASFAEHAVVDFNPIDPSKWRALSKKLQDFARIRGWLYRPSL